MPERLGAAERQAVGDAGLDGVPAFVMGRYVLFTGAVPADAMAEAFAKAWSVIGSQPVE